MEQLFAPWRIDWIERDEQNPDIEGCVFCELPERDDDVANRIVARSEYAYVLLNNYPYNPGHAMVIPRPHTGAYEALEDPVLVDHARLKQRAFRALDDALSPNGYNAGLNLGSGSGGSIAAHLHTHIVPRWTGDTNFMPVIGDTKVIVAALDDTFDRVRAAFATQDGVTADGDGAVQVTD